MLNLKAIYIVVFLLVAIERILDIFKGKEQGGKIHHKWTAPVLLFTYCLVALIALIDFILYVEKINFLITACGIVTMAGGIILRKSAIKTLGPNWSIHLKEASAQQLVTSGPYRFFRHPYYIAVMLELAGVSLYFNSLSALIILFFIHFPLLLYRTKLEERILLRQFGEKYLNYQKTHVKNT